jgi:hypothetical protein
MVTAFVANPKGRPTMIPTIPTDAHRQVILPSGTPSYPEAACREVSRMLLKINYYDWRAADTLV